MSNEKHYVLHGVDEQTALEFAGRPERGTARKTAAPTKELNPAMAFTYSLLFWGGGQLHNNQDWMGFSLAGLMFLFYGSMAAVAVWWDLFLESIRLLQVDISDVYLGMVLFCVLGLTIWLLSSLQAYLRASTSRVSSFNGVDNRVFPCICSFIIPGWGQFLNGQMKKGALFLLASLSGYSSLAVIVLTVLFWPILDAAPERIAVEWLLVPALLLLPAFLLVSLLSGYDALRISLDDVKKEPLSKRLEYANNRRRMQGWRRGVWPQVRLTMALSLVLCICLGVAYHMVPRDFYMLSLSTMKDLLAEHHMTLMASLIAKAIQILVV